jgi:hypothetical protein
MRCYVCGEPVSNETHKTILCEVDDMSLDENEVYVDRLGLVHCQGEDDQFDDNGNVVVCWTCHEYGKAGK